MNRLSTYRYIAPDIEEFDLKGVRTGADGDYSTSQVAKRMTSMAVSYTHLTLPTKA